MCTPRPRRRGILFQGRVYWRDLALLERGRLGDRLALVRLVDERRRVAGVGHAAGAELAVLVRVLAADDDLGDLEAVGAVKAAAPAARATRTLANCILIVLRVCLRWGGRLAGAVGATR